MATSLGTPELVADLNLVVGESPSWDPYRQLLYLVDIEGRTLCLFEPQSASHRRLPLDETPGAVAPRRSGGVLLATERGFVSIDPRSGATELLAGVEEKINETRMNDGKCDAEGRFWAGTTAAGGARVRGSLYSLDRNHTVTRVLTGFALSNGLGWSPDSLLMYHVDTPTRRIDLYDFDLAVGHPANRRPFATLAPADGLPDGLCVDTEGGVWVALWAGSAVRRYDPDGVLDRVVPLPVPNVTSCAFGGQTLRTLYITTARSDASTRGRGEGGLFCLDSEFQGLQPNSYAG
jgi:sugar lactone lactonase YvrE